MSASAITVETGKITDTLQGYFKHFLIVDDEILNLIMRQHLMQDQMKQQVDNVSIIGKGIQETAEAISGRINLQLSRDKRATKLKGDRTNGKGDRGVFQKLSQSVRLSTLNIVKATQQITQSNNADNLLSIRENDLRQHELILKADIAQLKRKLQHNADLLLLTEKLGQECKLLMQIVIDNDLSIYNVRLQQLQNKKMVTVEQKKSIVTLKLLMAKLHQLSSVVSEQSLKAITHSSQVAENARWITLALTLFICLGMIHFVMVIARRINRPLAALSNAMDALSSEQFDMRLEVSSDNDEFAVLATDFNQFARNTQRLIDDLAETRDSLEMQGQHIKAILDGVPEAILTLTSSGQIQSSNPTAELILGTNSASLIGKNIVEFLDESQNVQQLDDLVTRQAISQEFTGRDFNNRPFFMWLSLRLLEGPDNSEDVWVCVISDITEWKQAEEKLKTTSSELDAILENAMVGIAFIKHRVLFRVNHKFEQLFMCVREKIEGQSAQCLYPSAAAFEQLGEQAYRVLEMGESFEGQVELVRQNGEKFWCSISSKAINPDNSQEGTIWLFDDITEQYENEQRLIKLANFDSLTGLANRTVFHDRLGHALHKANRSSDRLALFFLDLDHFKNINDSLGHKAGDLLLCEVAKRLKSSVREGDTVARLGGDEFTVILEGIRSAEYVAKIAKKILMAISATYVIDAIEVSVSPSIGISLYPADGRDVDLLLKNADAAMYHAKENGRNNFQFYAAEMNAQAAERLEIETSLRRAVEQNEFCLYFQPQIDLRTGQISGAEALLRWNNELLGDVPLAKFIPILEDTGLINQVGEFVLKEACDAFMTLKDQLAPDFRLAVNLSGRQFKEGTLVNYIKQLLIDTGMSAKNLELEITESILMDDTTLAITTLNALSDLGIALAIDDFGTGYSSLSYLKLFPLDVLKIDRSFVRDITVDADDAAIVDAILAMSRRLKLEVVAEGVETADQLAFLQAHDCQRVQGYYFSEPLPFDALKEMIEGHVPTI